MLAKRVLVPLLIPLLGGPAFAEPDVGTTVAVTKAVILESVGSRKALSAGTVVHQNEIIVTAIDAKAEVELLDQTKLAIGPESRFILDRFVYDASASSASIIVNLSKGPLRFITGVAPKDSYEIRTPTALLGIRGTIFDIYVSSSGETAVLLLEGAVQVCNLAGVCRLQDEVGTILFVGVDGAISQYSKCENSFMRRIGFKTAFPFIGKKLLIDPVQRMSARDFECSPRRQPPIITARRITEPSPLPAVQTGSSSPQLGIWSGFYIGINGGRAWSHNSELTADLIPVEDDPPFGAVGAFGGGQVGYNWQRDRIVFGIEADLQGANISGSGLVAEGNAFAAADTSLNWFGTIRGRLGYTVGNALLYATGGFAFGGVEDKVTVANPVINPPSSFAKRCQNEFGFVVGGGLEIKFDVDWSAKIEYQFIDLGSDTLSTTPQSPFLVSGDTATAKFVHAYDTIRIGLNYHVPAEHEPLK